MGAHSAKRQTLLLTAVNTFVRALGLVMRVHLSRILGAEIMGIAELCSGVHMLAITPLTSGLPLAISRMTAKAKKEHKEMPLLAGIMLVRKASLVLIPALLLLSPALARVMGDARVLPSLWLTAPCILILGYSAVYNGYCYGMEKSWVPAISELIEQVVRFALSIGLVMALTRLVVPWLAAVPVFATMVAELLGLCYVLWLLKIPTQGIARASSWQKPVFRLAAPTTVIRLINTGLRSLTAIMIPLRLQASGLVASEATARLGMLNGMVMPIVLLPCIFTSALSMVSLPRLAKAEKNRPELRRMLLLCFGAALGVGLASWGLIELLAPFLAQWVYRLPELSELFRLAGPLVLLGALGHIASGVIAALGHQKRSMYGALATSAITLALTYTLTADPGYRLQGAILGQSIGQSAMLLWNLAILWKALRRK
ncbi:MAG: oligosaccharide flippase family protein [Candidatus Limiplasma sp.]|nr:oligosaccharide flippase family protein [Candidatus Limiplasma sp.]